MVNVCCGLLHFAIPISCGKIRNYELYFFVESVILILIGTKYSGFFVYMMSRVQIRACTKICIRRMYAIESTDEMQSIQNRVGERVMKNIRRIVLGMCLLIGVVCGNTVIVQADQVPTRTIGDYECTWYSEDESTTEIVKYNGSDAKITIPAELDGRKVSAIGDSAFAACTSLETVKISDGIECLKNNAFYRCSNLKNMTIPDSVTSIGDFAFYYCTGLQSIMIPKGVTSIGDSAFEECSSLESIMIPEGITSINKKVFSGCTGLRSVTLPEGIISIGQYGFSHCTSLQSIAIPESVTSIGGCAFCVCTSLQSITIPEGVTSIGGNAFSECTGLQSIVIPGSVTSIETFTFSDCIGLQSITIPEGVTSIKALAFYDCTNLIDVEFPESVKKIGPGLFGYTANELRVIYTIPGSYADGWLRGDEHKLDEDRFGVGYILNEENCRVKVLSEGDSSTVEYRNPIEKDAEEYTIPDTVTISGVTYRVTSIADDAFSACSNVKKVTLGQNVEQIQPDAFAGVVEEEGDLELVIPEKLEDISNIGIPNISNVNHLTINVAAGSKAEIYLQQNATIHYHTYPSTKNPEPDKKDDTEDASKNQAGVDEPVIGRSYPVGNGKYKMLSTDKVAFVGAVNKKKKTLKIPDVVTIAGRLHRVVRIEKRAMKGCATLQTVMIGNQVTEIGEEAFYKCKKLQKVTIGSRVVKIGKSAFRSDKKLKRLIFKGSKVKKIGKKALKGVPRKVKITAPKKSVTKYKKLLNAAK